MTSDNAKLKCTDCGIEFTIGSISEFTNSLPDRVCQNCSNDLIDGRWDAGEIIPNESRLGLESKHHESLWRAFGDERLQAGLTTRNGSSQRNINFINEKTTK